LENKVTSNTIRCYGINNDSIQVEVLCVKINGRRKRGYLDQGWEAGCEICHKKKQIIRVCCTYCMKAVTAVQQPVLKKMKADYKNCPGTTQPGQMLKHTSIWRFYNPLYHSD
jgi:hypothetical protein